MRDGGAEQGEGAGRSFPFTLTEHAADAIREREIPLAWVARVLSHPTATHADREDPELRHALAPIPEYGGRVLRVVYNQTVRPWRVVTAYFDRSQGRLG